MLTGNHLNEFLGTMFFVYVIIVVKEPVAIALALLAAILASKKGMTAHFNPAVSLAKAMQKGLHNNDLWLLPLSQIAGALAAVELTKLPGLRL